MRRKENNESSRLVRVRDDDQFSLTATCWIANIDHNHKGISAN
jgi:hypothetical protein